MLNLVEFHLLKNDPERKKLSLSYIATRAKTVLWQVVDICDTCEFTKTIQDFDVWRYFEACDFGMQLGGELSWLTV